VERELRPHATEEEETTHETVAVRLAMELMLNLQDAPNMTNRFSPAFGCLSERRDEPPDPASARARRSSKSLIK